MKKFLVKKNKKKIKVKINKNIITVYGPLGSIDYIFKNHNILNSNLYNLYILKENINFFLKKIFYLFKCVTKGWFLELNLNGVGYKCFKTNNEITLDIGYSNLVTYKPSDKIKIKIFKNKIILFSLEKSYLNNIAFFLRNYAIPDNYKGKGILFKNENLKLKKKK